MTTSESKRRGEERRLRARPELKYLLFGGRRKSARRVKDERAFFYVDQYRPGLLALIVLLVILSLADGLSTLHLVAHGASETNPIMAYLLDIGPWPFMVAKFFLTLLAVVIFLILQNFRSRILRFQVKNLILAFVVVYLTIMFWHLFLAFLVD